ncbi:MAG: hypothetical protein KDD94_11080, partial [Calditrichaeota bacterium]|nr:hypothetical protein [Calditrichota bacterium]
MRYLITHLILFILLFSQDNFNYTLDLSNPSDDYFHVTMNVNGLSSDDGVFSFVAFAPGVHQVLNFGRFIETFKAFDKNGDEIDCKKSGTNEWIISDPESVTKIVYEMNDSFDFNFEKNLIFPMSGIGIEPGYAIVNTHGVFGYFKNHRNRPITLSIKYPSNWTIGTALNGDGHNYKADSFYQLADSPILIGELDKSSKKIGDIEVEVYSYWPDKSISADTILQMVEPVLKSAYDFIGYAPVKRYSFLMYFYDREASKRNPGLRGGGALEHSMSSTYSLPAQAQFLPILPSIIAHEFMHILTPLNLRSEIIDQFDYSKATSEDIHVWLYEGVTEWVAHKMQLQSGLISLQEYLDRMTGKINSAFGYDPDFSLVRISQEWMTEKGNPQYGNIYQQGALTAMALDIKLLQLSNGKRGLRDVYIDLIKAFGRSKPFRNDEFFDIFVQYTDPQIRSFIDTYIKGTEAIDYAALFKPLGINVIPERPSKNTSPLLGLQFGNDMVISGFSREYVDFGLKIGDIIVKLLGEEIGEDNLNALLERKNKMKVGDS